MRPATVASSASRFLSSPVPLPVMVGTFCILWSSAFAVAKIALADCPPLLLLTLRFLVAGTLMLTLAWLSGARWTLGRREIALFAVLGVANQAVYLGIGYMGLREISSGLSVLIFSANPIVTAILATLVLGEPMNWRKAAGLLLGLGGVAFIVARHLSVDAGQLRGIILTVIATLSFVAGTILFKRFAPKDGLWLGNGVQSLSAGVASLPFALAFESVGDVAPTWRLLAALAYLAFAVSIFAYLLWFQILAVSGATAASSYYFLMPPLGVFFGWLLVGEHVAVTDMLGIIPVVLGIYLATRPSRAASRA